MENGSDLFFKRTFQHPEVTKGFLQTFLQLQSHWNPFIRGKSQEHRTSRFCILGPPQTTGAPFRNVEQTSRTGVRRSQKAKPGQPRGVAPTSYSGKPTKVQIHARETVV